MREYGEVIDFRLVYIREAHPVDGAAPIKSGKGPLIEDPLHLGERRLAAQECVADLELEGISALIDDVDDRAARVFQAWPDRLVLIDTTGVVIYQGQRGPYGFSPDELEEAIQAKLRGS